MANLEHEYSGAGFAGAAGAASALGLLKPVAGDRPDPHVLDEYYSRILFGQTIFNYTYSARRAYALMNDTFKSHWKINDRPRILFRGTYSREPYDTWDSTFKHVIATSSSPVFAFNFARKLFNAYGGSAADFTGHVYILVVAPGVPYIDVDKQIVMKTYSNAVLHEMMPPSIAEKFKTLYSKEDEYVLESNPNVKIIYDSPVYPAVSTVDINTRVTPNFNNTVYEILKNTTHILHPMVASPPQIFPGIPRLRLPFMGSFRIDEENNVSKMQFHVALYGYDGQQGGSPSVFVGPRSHTVDTVVLKEIAATNRIFASVRPSALAPVFNAAAAGAASAAAAAAAPAAKHGKLSRRTPPSYKRRTLRTTVGKTKRTPRRR
jgi:hypothetical protein